MNKQKNNKNVKKSQRIGKLGHQAIKVLGQYPISNIEYQISKGGPFGCAQGMLFCSV